MELVCDPSLQNQSAAFLPDGAGALPLLVGDASDPGALRDGIAIAEALGNADLRGLAAPGAPHRGIELLVPGAGEDGREGWVLRGAIGPAVILGRDDVAKVRDRIDRLERLLEADLGELQETETIDLRFAGQAVLRRTSTSG